MSRRFVVIASACLFVLLAAAAAVSFRYAVFRDSAVVMRVNGLPVTRAEFQFQMEREKGRAEAYFWSKYSVNSAEKGFWGGKYGAGGERPADVLRTMAKEAAIKTKVLQSLALSHGLTDNVDFDRIRLTMDGVNKQRRDAFDNGGVLYGTVEFEFLTYWLQMESNYETELGDAMAGVEVTVSDEEVRARYDAYYEEFHNENSFTVAELFIPYLPYGEAPDENVTLDADDAWAQANAAYDAIIGGRGFDDVCETYTGDAPAEYTLDWQAASVGSIAGLIERASGLAVGDVSKPFENGFGFSIIKMINNRVSVDVSYEDAYADLYSAQMAENFRAYIDRQTQDAVTDIKEFVYSNTSIS